MWHKVVQMRLWLTSSLWFVPAAGGLGIAGISGLLVFLETRSWIPENLLLSTSVGIEQFSTIAGVLLGAVVTIIGIVLPMVFSMIQKAASQYSPEVLLIYRKLSSVKVLLALMLGVVLSQLILLVVTSLGWVFFVPKTAFLFVLVLLTALLVSLPVFFSWFVTALEPTFLASAIRRDLEEALESFESVTECTADDELAISQDRQELLRVRGSNQLVSQRSGYLTLIDTSTLVEILKARGAIGRVLIRPGHFVFQGDPLLYYSAEADLSEQDKIAVAESFQIADQRWGITDLELQLDQLVSVGVRALSPGVNELATAMQSIHQIALVCRLMLNRHFLSGVHKDGSKEVRLLTKEFDFQGFIHAAFDRLRQNGKEQPSVVVVLLHVMHQLVIDAKSKERARYIAQQAKCLVHDALPVSSTVDQGVISQRLASIKKDAM